MYLYRMYLVDLEDDSKDLEEVFAVGEDPVAVLSSVQGTYDPTLWVVRQLELVASSTLQSDFATLLNAEPPVLPPEPTPVG